MVEGSFRTSFYCFGCLVGLPSNAGFEVRLRRSVVAFPGDVQPRIVWGYEYGPQRLRFVWLSFIPQTGKLFCFSCMREHDWPDVSGRNAEWR